MVASKHIDKIVIAAMLSAVLISILMVGFKPKAVEEGNMKATVMEYEQKIFDTAKPLVIDIIMDADKWKDLLENAAEKKWQSCDVVVNGTRFFNVGIRAKGDSSLSSIAEAPNSNRYSLKLEFDKYIENQTCFGLDKLCLNNNYGDPTNMKEAFVYDMFRYLGADASLYNYADISVNGSYWGVYLALEGVEDSFLKRNYGDRKGALYKPGQSKGAVGEEEWEESKDLGQQEGFEAASFGAENMDDNGGEGGAELAYIDDDPASYWGIFPCQINKTNREDHRRTIKALKHVSEKKDLEKYVDMDNVLRYMAVHSFAVNNDSLSGDGAHNYYLYERNGKLNLIPWDYNLCFGAYEMESAFDNTSGAGTEGYAETAEDMINHPIDDPWPITSFFDGILQNDEYRAQYHKYYQQLVDRYILGGGFEVFYTRTRMRIDRSVRLDPNALYSYEAYDKGAEMLKKAVMLRGKSVKGQLNGQIPSTLEGQKESPGSLIDADNIDLRTMGSDSVGEEGEWKEAEVHEKDLTGS